MRNVGLYCGLVLLIFPSLSLAQDKEGTATLQGKVSLGKGDKKQLSSILVIVRAVKGEKVSLPKKGVVATTVNGRKPFLLVVGVNSTVSFQNRKKTICNFKVSHPTLNFNEGVSPGDKVDKQLSRAAKLKVLCSCHSGEESWVVVLKESHFARVDEKGNFEIKGLKAGKRRIEFWHPELQLGGGGYILKEKGQQRVLGRREKLLVKAGKVTTLTIEEKSSKKDK